MNQWVRPPDGRDESLEQYDQMIAATRDNPHVSRVVVPSGGHNFGVYRPYVGPGLRWLTRQNVLG